MELNQPSSPRYLLIGRTMYQALEYAKCLSDRTTTPLYMIAIATDNPNWEQRLMGQTINDMLIYWLADSTKGRHYPEIIKFIATHRSLNRVIEFRMPEDEEIEAFLDCALNVLAVDTGEYPFTGL